MSEQAISTTELAEAAGRPRIDPNDPITILEEHAKRVIAEAKLSDHHRMMALPKLAELCFWIRAGRDRK